MSVKMFDQKCVTAVRILNLLNILVKLVHCVLKGCRSAWKWSSFFLAHSIFQISIRDRPAAESVLWNLVFGSGSAHVRNLCNVSQQ